MVGISDALKGKLESLVSYLCQITKGFESIAVDIECANLKTAIYALSVEAKQYSEEISDQLRELNITIPLTVTDQLWKKIEAFVKENNYSYLTDRFIEDAAETQDLVLKLPNLISEDSLENKRKIEILRSFLFDDLKLHFSCLHFYTDKLGVNGSGQIENFPLPLG